MVARAVRRTLAIVAGLLLAGAVTASWLLASDERPSRTDASAPRATVPPPAAPTRGCTERVESGVVYKPDPATQVVVGPASLGDFVSSYRDAAARVRAGELDGVVPMKSYAIIEAGTRVTIAVPKGQRRWLRLTYRIPFERRGQDAMRLVACRRFSSPAEQRAECDWAPRLACRSATTQFSGGILVDFHRAPRLARCAAVDMWIDDKPGPKRRWLFDPPRGACRGGP